LKDKELRYESPSELILDDIRHKIEEILKLNTLYKEKNKKDKNIISDFI